jgi:hypothetical protein
MRLTIDLSGAETVQALPGVIARLGPKLTKLAAQEWTTETLDWIGSGRSFVSRSGELEQTISWVPRGAGAEVFAQAAYAGFVEFPTKPHVIRPKNRKALRVPISGGGYFFAKKVNHPGTAGKPFLWADTPGRIERTTKTLISYIADQVTA